MSGFMAIKALDFNCCFKMEVLFFNICIFNSIMSRRGWSQKEDQVVKALVEKIGAKNWSAVAHQLSHQFKFKERTGKQCRERYHNHLDPKISKLEWLPEQEETLFRLHKVYGNKWTSIAEHLPGRTDNTIKNHFYSTIRRSLRRMSKLIGSKNSTRQMKYIKPSTLSKIFAINTKPISIQQIQEQKRKCAENLSYRQLVNYINQQCHDLTDYILKFSNFKPKGKKGDIDGLEKVIYEKVLQKMENLNEKYEKMRKQQRRISLSMSMQVQGSSDSDSDDDQNSSRQQIKVTKITRSKRQIKAPRKFEQQILAKAIKSTKRERRPILIKKNSLLIEQLQQKNNQYPHERFELYKKQSDRVKQDLGMLERQADFEILIKDNNQNNQYPFAHFSIGPTTPVAFNTEFYFQTPALQQLSSQSPGCVISANSRVSNAFFSHFPTSWNFKTGQLEEMTNNLCSQISKNISENKEDGKTSSSSNINSSPHSAFKSCQ